LKKLNFQFRTNRYENGEETLVQKIIRVSQSLEELGVSFNTAIVDMELVPARRNSAVALPLTRMSQVATQENENRFSPSQPNGELNWWRVAAFCQWNPPPQ